MLPCFCRIGFYLCGKMTAMDNRMKNASLPDELLSYWESQREFFLCAMLWDEEDLSDLAAIQKVYGNIDEVKQKWTHDLIELDRQAEYDDVCYETGQVIQEVLELTQQVDMKFGIYKRALEWHEKHPCEPEECYEFLFAGEDV